MLVNRMIRATSVRSWLLGGVGSVCFLSTASTPTSSTPHPTNDGRVIHLLQMNQRPPPVMVSASVIGCLKGVVELLIWVSPGALAVPRCAAAHRHV
jgi:hypothetical protein